jgi:hypothetical protein
MKINEILVESQQLDEGPVGSAVNAVGRGVGKVIGGAARAAGAVAGVPGGVKRAFQTGKQASTDFIGGTNQAAAPQATAPTAQSINQAGPKGTAPAKQQTGVAAQAMQKTAQATAGQNAAQAGQTLYAQVKAQINQLDRKGKQRILQLLQKSLQQTPAQAAPQAAQPAAAPKRGQPVKVTRTKAAPTAQPAVQTAGKINSRPALKESFSFYRKNENS